MVEQVQDPEYEERLRWRLELLKVELEEGKIRVPDEIGDEFSKSLSAVRYGPDGKIDLSTVDARVRSLSLAVAGLRQREDAKNAISLPDISSTYFEFVERNLGFLSEQAQARGVNAHQFAMAVSSSPSAIEELAPQLSDFLDALNEFWLGVAESSHYHIQDLAGSKAVFGGDLFPSHLHNVASTVGLYADTIVATDPFFQTRHIFDHAADQQRIYYLVKHAINVLKYKDVALADTNLPIFVLSPFQSSLDEQVLDVLRQTSATDAVKHADRLFGRRFGSFEEVTEFCETLNDPEDVVRALNDSGRLLFDTEFKNPLVDQIREALGFTLQEKVAGGHAGRLIASQSLSRMMQAGDLLMKSRYLGGTPFTTAPTSWQYFNWKLEYNAAEDIDHAPLHMIRGLQHVANTDEPWIAKIPPDALIQMRRDGALEEIRAALSSGIDEIASVNPGGFFRSSDRIVENIRDAFAKHNEKIEALRQEKIRFVGYDVGTWLVAGAIEIGAAIAGTPAFGLATVAADQLLDAPKIKELPERYRRIRNASVELKKSPMGMLFSHK